ncbi:type II toxin-antitoxin system HicB family antitoxin [Thermoanaerobacterium thermosaccharolyticum]|uniref:type II toxin-antitoxin system HicB family antitoxin n=1 Tax=Thermoanaerobacterium thermosaccharolyticum TaxID=1517 RepID=UPI001787652B|nr:type II toxin-antitoxin system HicB family antitoxin [Thermoanaerobacterium thermosaccharolyticum]MBE0068672.1 type II toxin-antitoxin system HicB family antitoxin [Thermoanaerobacterium thermosaccharolyticum]MBE0228650.1 type II toxin-antitoxin system HicB family antitoxin [Thermoanaerobacterium thermosaccharolyticum]
MERKSLDYYLSLKYPFKIEVLSENDGGGFFITYPDLPGCMSDGKTLEETIAMGEDAKKAWIKTRYKNNMEIPEPFSSEDRFNGRITLRTPKSLHRELVKAADEEGTSLNQYIIYLLSKGLKENRKYI